MFIELDGWRGKLRFSSCHLIPGHPKCGRLHGHTYAVSVRLEGELENEFLIDFFELKEIVKKICDELDHRVLIAEKDPRLKIRDEEDGYSIVVGKKRYLFPKEDVALLPINSVASEYLSRYIAERIASQLSGMKNLKRLHVRVDEGMGQGAGCTLEV
jgi:6-pyruvoyltetrahydropterin/6-carboxytetrahydropterin synthase